MIVVSTWSFGARGNEAAWARLAADGSALDAVEAACRVVESAPDVDSVGFGGLPDAEGRVSLDACVMLSPRRSGAVCAMGRHVHAATVARRVMERTPHFLLAGEGADAFADAEGFARDALLADSARDAWMRWRESPRPVDQSKDSELRPMRPIDAGPESDGRLFRAVHDEERWRHHDTIGVLALDRSGTMAGACSTSGTPFKLPGRVGDSPIVGHGLYVDPAVGGACATGCGELVMGVCGSFLAVELMRSGRHPLLAAAETLERIVAGAELQPEHQVAIVALARDGTYGAAAIRPGFRVSIRDGAGPRIEDPGRTLLDGSDAAPHPAERG